MNLQKLISVLGKQEQNIKNLFQIGLDKKGTLVSNNYNKLNEIVALEEQCLLSIQLTEEARLKIMQELFLEYNIDNNRYKLEILILNLKGKVDPQLLNNITDYEDKIKNTIKDVTSINSLNMMLIKQSKNLINETINAVVNFNSKSILDRKG